MELVNHRFHFIGVGGIGMCGLAELLYKMGAQVSGSDLSQNSQTLRLGEMGVQVSISHDAQHVKGADVVVFSSAIPETNVEMIAARNQGIPLIPRAEALAEIMRLKKGIAVAGTHGKTTTTSLLAHSFFCSGKSPTVVVGGKLKLNKSTALLGVGEWCIAEADESDGSFSKLSPEIAIITNIDSDHLSHFKSFANVKKAFYDFALKVPFYGRLIACGDDPTVREIFASYPKKIIYYGSENHNDYRIVRKGVTTAFYKGEELLGECELPFPGEHFALNALATYVASYEAGLSEEDALKGLATFTGVERRFEKKGQHNDLYVYDDYAHHPTEIKATLSSVREKFPDHKVVAYFQPHRFSRVRDSWAEFLTCFGDCDELLLTDIYPGGEPAMEGVTGQGLWEAIQHSNKKFLEADEKLPSDLFQFEKKLVFISMGAGDSWKKSDEAVEILNKFVAK